MAEQTFPGTTTTTKQGSQGGKSGSDASRNMREQASSTGQDFKEKAADLAGTSGDKIKEQASEFAGAARDVASQATDKIQQTVSEQKGAGAEYVGNLAEALRRASREFDNELPIAGKYIRKAASQVENVADSIRTGDLSDLMDGAKDFARRQPAAFLGLATLAGFLAVRFLKSSPDAARSSYRTSADERPRPLAESRSPAEYRGYQEQRDPTEYRTQPRPSSADYVG
jgi:gas vesicle protein